MMRVTFSHTKTMEEEESVEFHNAQRQEGNEEGQRKRKRKRKRE